MSVCRVTLRSTSPTRITSGSLASLMPQNRARKKSASRPKLMLPHRFRTSCPSFAAELTWRDASHTHGVPPAGELAPDPAAAIGHILAVCVSPGLPDSGGGAPMIAPMLGATSSNCASNNREPMDLLTRTAITVGSRPPMVYCQEMLIRQCPVRLPRASTTWILTEQPRLASARKIAKTKPRSPFLSMATGCAAASYPHALRPASGAAKTPELVHAVL